MKCNPSFEIHLPSYMLATMGKTCEQIGELTLDLMNKAMAGDRKSLYATGYIRKLFMHWGRPSIPKHLRILIKTKYGGKCVACGSAERIQIDHIKPVAHGGKSTKGNLQVLCAPCNRKKGPQSWTRK